MCMIEVIPDCKESVVSVFCYFLRFSIEIFQVFRNFRKQCFVVNENRCFSSFRKSVKLAFIFQGFY
ncbi:Uncharacterised protein [Mycobacteroides abscessus subsp. abscessus]|nr:Uncharacterised protein [Mycobacteroides abscessus subsp. abscessus]